MIRLNPARWPLRAKFSLILLLLLLVPWSAFLIVAEIEKTLVDNLKKTLALSSNLISQQLRTHAEWFESGMFNVSTTLVAPEIQVSPLTESITVDGFLEEWQELEKYRLDIQASPKSAGTSQAVDSMGLLVGNYERYVYLYLDVKDNQVIYPAFNSTARSDQVVIDFIDANNQFERLYLSPGAPGKIPVKISHEQQFKIDWRYHAMWHETTTGFSLELKFPGGVRPQQLKVTFYDVDQPGEAEFSNRLTTSPHDLSPLIWPSEKLTEFVSRLITEPGQRVWILSPGGRALARKGSLKTIPGSGGGYIVNWLLSVINTSLVDQRGDQTQLNSAVIYDAIRGKTSISLERSNKGEHSIALAASPIVSGDKVIGVVFIEENVESIQLKQQKALLKILYTTGVILLAVFIILILYVSRLSLRIMRLSRQINTVVDEQGRMTGPIEIEEVVGDEIDDLSNAFLHMGNKLYDYNDYLEKLASRLSHELRTPIAIVQSSLDNLLLDKQSKDNQQTIERAIGGTQRLGEIIRRMRQASGIKEAMQTATFESVDLISFVGRVVEGFEHSFQQYQFEFRSRKTDIREIISPDLFAEMLDKLLSNAMDFSPREKPIIISVDKIRQVTEITVTNFGPPIQKKNLRKIFNSLVSIRESGQERENNIAESASPNLGLGLYVVKLIADYHRLKVSAENLTDGLGVEFKIRFPKR